jgi:hypothetical protein
MRLANTESELTTEFADTTELGALARGDVFDGETVLAYYFARWFPERTSDLEMLVVLVTSPNHISVGFGASPDGTLRFTDDLWMDWSPLAIHSSVSEATATYPDLGKRARAIAGFLLLHDPALPHFSCTTFNPEHL